MGEHKQNLQAMFAASIPPLTNAGERVAIELQAVVMPARDVLLVEEKNMGDGGAKIRLPGKDEYEDAPEGARVFKLGEQLPAEACDLVIVLGTRMATNRVVAGPDGKTGQLVSQVGHVPICRIPLEQWRREHAAQTEIKN